MPFVTASLIWTVTWSAWIQNAGTGARHGHIFNHREREGGHGARWRLERHCNRLTDTVAAVAHQALYPTHGNRCVVRHLIAFNAVRRSAEDAHVLELGMAGSCQLNSVRNAPGGLVSRTNSFSLLALLNLRITYILAK